MIYVQHFHEFIFMSFLQWNIRILVYKTSVCWQKLAFHFAITSCLYVNKFECINLIFISKKILFMLNFLQLQNMLCIFFCKCLKMLYVLSTTYCNFNYFYGIKLKTKMLADTHLKNIWKFLWFELDNLYF